MFYNHRFVDCINIFLDCFVYCIFLILDIWPLQIIHSCLEHRFCFCWKVSLREILEIEIGSQMKTSLLSFAYYFPKELYQFTKSLEIRKAMNLLHLDNDTHFTSPNFKRSFNLRTHWVNCFYFLFSFSICSFGICISLIFVLLDI